MITEIRDYFKAVLAEVDSGLSQHDEWFSADNIADTRLEDKYFIEFGALATDREDRTNNGVMPLSISIWKNGYRDVIDRLDAAYNCAIEIQALAMDQTRIDQTNFMKSVEGTTITPEAVASNDNLGKFTLQFNVGVSYQA